MTLPSYEATGLLWRTCQPRIIRCKSQGILARSDLLLHQERLYERMITVSRRGLHSLPLSVTLA